MRRIRESCKLLSRLAAAAERTASGPHAGMGGLWQPAAAPQQLLQAFQLHSLQCSRLLPGSQGPQGRRLYQLVSLRQLNGGPTGSSAGDSKIVEMMHQRLGKKAGDQLLYGLAVAIAMVGVTYGAVPLYRLFCQATGYGGTVQEGATVEAKLKARQEAKDEALEAACAAREITVFFNADVNDNLPWKFAPTQRSVTIHPGQSTLAFYTAQNMSDKAITGVSTYNVTPQSAGSYFNKIQCFCFEEQKLRPGEKIDMPVFFYVDPEFATDVRLSNISNLTLSYTFFKVSEEEVEQQEEAAALGSIAAAAGTLAAAAEVAAVAAVPPFTAAALAVAPVELAAAAATAVAAGAVEVADEIASPAAALQEAMGEAQAADAAAQQNPPAA